MSIKVIAEIGCNHKGDFEVAKELSKIYATYCNADIIKFQKRTPKELLTKEEYESAHPNLIHSYGKTYGEHRENLELSIEQHRELKNIIEEFGKVYSTSVWDITSAREVINLNPKLIKVPSAQNNNKNLISELVNGYDGEIHISLGMTTKEEELQLIHWLGSAISRTVIYACSSGYPIEFSDVCLLEILRLKKLYGGQSKIGYSGHHLGIAIDIGAATLLECDGFIERHVTGFGGRVWKGTDHAASLEPDGFKKLVRDIRALEQAYTFKSCDILDIELAQRKKLKSVK